MCNSYGNRPSRAVSKRHEAALAQATRCGHSNNRNLSFEDHQPADERQAFSDPTEACDRAACPHADLGAAGWPNDGQNLQALIVIRPLIGTWRL